MKNRKGILVLLLTFTVFFAKAQQFPFQNPKLSPEERAKDLVSRLTLKEKATLMCDISDAIPRLGIKKFNWWSEALHGYANNNNVSVFPEPIGMAASFDDLMVFNVFDAVSDEARAKYNESMKKGGESHRFQDLSVWTPNVNIFRDPRWGRGQETYGEDPYLTSRMGVSVVKGLQGPADSTYRKLLACAKHYAVHSGPEWSRHEINLNNVSMSDLWQTYLPAFKALVQKADVREVMCAYQRLDDEPCCGSDRLLQQILRNDWGYKYLVVSDCGAVSDFYTSHHVSSDAKHAAAKAVLAGTDVECNFGYTFDKLPKAVADGLIKESKINESVIRLMTQRFALGEMDDPALVSWSKIPASVINSEEHQKLALQMARESMTLLQNSNNILPLSNKRNKIAVIGPNANDAQMLWGNYNGTPVHTITILDGIKGKVGADKVIYDKGCDLVDDKILESAIPQSSAGGKSGIKATYWNNRNYSGDVVTTEQLINPLKLSTTGQHEFASGVHLEGFSARYETVYKATKSGDLVFKLEAAGAFQLSVNGESKIRTNNWRPTPSRVSVHVEEGREYKIEIQYAQLNNWSASLNFDFGFEKPVNYNALLEKLKGVNLVIFVGGISPKLEGEEMPVQLPGFKGGDRTDIELPAVQRNCLKALKAAGKTVIYVNCSGSAIALVPETQSCDAILQAWYSGEAGGQAVADVLFGDYNPNGHLPVTFYRNLQQLPEFTDYSMKGRTYRYMSTDPLFPFGFGLSYTTFRIGEGKLDKTTLGLNEGVELSVPVKNTGKKEGTEVVQVYLKKLNDTVGPIKTLRGFNRVALKPGETQLVKLALPSATFETYDAENGRMAVQPGKYELFYGSSSDNKDLQSIEVTVQ